MPRGTSKYSLIADQLMREIRAGALPVGGLLPTETELMRAYGVSRHTARSAVQDLKSRGVVASRQGQGSTVISEGEAATYVERIQSIEQLNRFAEGKQRKMLSFKIIEADEDLSEKFKCELGRRLLIANMLRCETDEQARPVAVLTLMMDALFMPIIDLLDKQHRSAADIIREHFGYEVGCVTQTIGADLLSRDAAEHLEADAGAAALVIERDYATSKNAPPHLVAHSIYPADVTQVISQFVRSDTGAE